MSRRLAQRGSALVIIGLLAVAVVGLLSGGGVVPDRAYQLELQLRCPVCKGVSIAESMSPDAAAMRQVVTEQIAAGRSDAQIIDFFRARYSDWILLDPPAAGVTLSLWLLPPAAVGLGLAVLLARVRRRRAEDPELSAQARGEVAAALARMRDLPQEDDEP